MNHTLVHKNNLIESAKKYQFLTGYSLKMLGVALMVIDHIHQMFGVFGIPHWVNIPGRACLPIFLFMASEGFHYTRSRKKYLLRLLVAFWFMGAGNMLLTYLFPIDDIQLINNVFGTMLLSVFYMWMIDILKNGAKQKKIPTILFALGGMTLPLLSYLVFLWAFSGDSLIVMRLVLLFMPTIFTVEGGFASVLLAVSFYLLRNHRLLQMIPLILVSILAFFGGGYQWLMCIAIVPILLYNGKPGKKSKNFFYIFYPAHIYLFYIISYFFH